MGERENDLINPMDLDPVTESQFNVYKIIFDFFNENGIPPTIREVAAGMKEKHKRSDSTGAVHPAIDKLVELGYLARIGKKKSARNLVPQIDASDVRIKKR